MSDSASVPSSSKGTAASKARVCAGEACNRFLPRVEKDDHALCVKCRGQECTRSRTCSVCDSWTEEQWTAALVPSSRQVKKQRAASRALSTPSTSEGLRSPDGALEKQSFASTAYVSRVESKIDSLTSVVENFMKMFGRSKSKTPSSVASSYEATEEGASPTNPSLLSLAGLSRGRGSSRASGGKGSSTSPSPPPAKKRKHRTSNSDDRFLKGEGAGRKDVPGTSGGRRDEEDVVDVRPVGGDGRSHHRGTKRDREGRPSSPSPASKSASVDLEGLSAAASSRDVSLFASGALESSSSSSAARGPSVGRPSPVQSSPVQPARASGPDQGAGPSSPPPGFSPLPGPGPCQSVPPGFKPLAPGTLRSPVPLVPAGPAPAGPAQQDRPVVRGSVLSLLSDLLVPTPVADTGLPRSQQRATALPGEKISDQAVREASKRARQRREHDLSSSDDPAVTDSVLAALPRVVKAASEGLKASCPIQPSSRGAFGDVSAPLAASSPKVTLQSRDKGSSKTERLEATDHTGLPSRPHGKSQDRQKGVQKSEGTRLPDRDPGREKEGSGRLPRGLTTSGRDRDRGRSSREGRSPDRSRSHKSRHDHLEDRTSSRSGADSAGSRSRRRHSSSPDKKASRRRSRSRSPRRHHRQEKEGGRHRGSRSSEEPRRSPPRTSFDDVSSGGEELEPKTDLDHDTDRDADPDDDPEPAPPKGLIFGEYNFDEVLALLRGFCGLEPLYPEVTKPTGSTVLQSLTAGQPAAAPTRELPWLQLAASSRASLEKQLQEDVASTSSSAPRVGSDRFVNPIIKKMKWYPIRGESSKPMTVNGKALDLVDRARHDQVLKPHYSFNHTDVEHLETTFGGMSRISNFMDVSLVALTNCLRDSDMSRDAKEKCLKIILAASRANETLSRQSEVSRANILLRRRDAVLSKIFDLPQEDRLKLRSAPLGGHSLFPDDLLASAQQHTRSVVQDQAIRRAVQTGSRTSGYQRGDRSQPPPSQSFSKSSKGKGKKSKSTKSTPSNPPPQQQQHQQHQQQQQQNQGGQQPFRGRKGKGGGYKGKK